MPQEATVENTAAPSDAATGEASKREKSTIQFPYLAMEEAVGIAKGVHEVGGNACQVDQLAAHLQQKPDTGAFRLKMLTAKMFGLVTYSMGTVTLTPLGSRVCDPQQEQTAKAESFMLIPLYQKVYEQFKGANLPPLAGLEAAMVNMGVAPKQKDTARQVFQRSAQYAGFFWSSKDRLVYPRIKGNAAGASPGAIDPAIHTEEQEKLEREKNNSGSGGGGGGQLHPFIQGLLATLPKTGELWNPESRAEWLQAAVSMFNLIYKSDPDSGRVEVRVQKQA